MTATMATLARNGRAQPNASWLRGHYAQTQPHDRLGGLMRLAQRVDQHVGHRCFAVKRVAPR